jgi:hypothetical protein
MLKQRDGAEVVRPPCAGTLACLTEGLAARLREESGRRGAWDDGFDEEEAETVACAAEDVLRESSTFCSTT